MAMLFLMLGILFFTLVLLFWIFGNDIAWHLEIGLKRIFKNHKGKPFVFACYATYILFLVLGAAILAMAFYFSYQAGALMERNYYQVTLNNGESYKVAEFTFPGRRNPYYRGMVDGELVVFEDIHTYKKLEETYILNELNSK